MIRYFLAELRFTLALRQVVVVSLCVGFYALIPVMFNSLGVVSNIERFSTGLEALLGILLGLLLVFRANRAYERWWEARSQWGLLVNVSRNLAIKIKTLINPDTLESENYHYLISQYCVALLHHLQGKYYAHLSDSTKMSQQFGLTNDTAHVPVYITQQLYEKVYESKKNEVITDVEFLQIDTDLSQFMHVAGACEKIKNTLISLSYRSFVHHIMVILFLFLPWQLVHNYNLWTIPLVIILSYMGFALEGIARHMEEPFGKSVDDVQMAEICQVIDKSVKQILV